MSFEGPSRARRRLVAPLCLALVAFVACSKSVEEQIAEARLQQEVGSFQESIETLQAVLDEAPDDAEANLLLGSAQVAMGQPALAIWPLEVAGRSPEFADQADLALGAAYLGLEQRDSALQAADRVLARDPEDPNLRKAAITIRASANLSSKDFDATLEDVDRLLAMDPENPEALALMAQAFMGAGRTEEAEAAMRRLWNSPTQGNTAAAARAGIALAKLEAYEQEDMASAEKVLEGLMERFPQNASVLAFVTDFLAANDRAEFAVQLLRDALERDPGDLNVRSELADHLKAEGKEDEAEALLVEATELFDSPQAWLVLADFYRAEGRYAESLAAFERILELVPGASDILRFRYADILADAGEYDRAAAAAADIEGMAYRNVVLGRLAFIEGDYEEALRLLDEALKEWPNNPGARYLAARSALALGDLDRALSELRESTRVGIAETNAPIELGLLYLALDRPAQAVSLATLILNDEDFQRGPRLGHGMILLARANWEVGHKDMAREHARRAAIVKGFRETSALELARFEAEENGPAAAAQLLLDAKLDLTDPENEAALRQTCDYLVAAGKGDEAVRLAEGALAAHSDSAAVHDVFGRVLVAVGRGNEAMASFERALELDPDHAPALEGQASLRQAGGDAEGARELFDRAAEVDPANAAYPYHAAQIELAAGRVAAAEERLRETLRRDPLHAHASNDLAWILAERGESLDRALALAKRASQVDGSAAIFDTLGWVQYRRGAHPAAVAAFERAHELDPASPSISYRLGLALVETGERARAEALFREALAAGSFPEADAARVELARLTEAS
jgi:tetratricopeptide (TPR) repeat protein